MFLSGFSQFLEELEVFLLLKLQISQFPLLADNYASQQ
jgi:hypothetical protein